MAQSVNTVTGTLAPRELGVTLVHEHLIFGYPGWGYDTAAPAYDRKKTAALCVEMIRDAQKYGLKTIIDATPNDGTRDPELYKMVSQETGINIICATGLYTEEEGAPVYFKTRAHFSGNPAGVVREMYETFMKDITVGIEGSGVKAGVIKVGTGKGKISSYEEMVLEAAVMAQKDTGVPIITHTDAGSMGPQQADYLISKGVDVKKLMIGHMCGSSDLQYHREVLQKGVFTALDRFGLDIIFPDSQRTATLLGLLREGRERQIMISQDSVMQWLGRPFTLPEPALPLVANWNISHIFKNIIPALKEAKITDSQIRTMLVDNPARLFAGE